jgi:hypothetical protein
VSEKPSTLSVIRWLIERDLRTLVKSPFILINRTIFFLIQLFVFAVLVSKLASTLGFNYFDFYSVGAVVSTITSIAFIIGEDLCSTISSASPSAIRSSSSGGRWAGPSAG